MAKYVNKESLATAVSMDLNISKLDIIIDYLFSLQISKI